MFKTKREFTEKEKETFKVLIDKDTLKSDIKQTMDLTERDYQRLMKSVDWFECE